jgi:hypothetical protein
MTHLSPNKAVDSNCYCIYSERAVKALFFELQAGFFAPFIVLTGIFLAAAWKNVD